MAHFVDTRMWALQLVAGPIADTLGGEAMWLASLSLTAATNILFGFCHSYAAFCGTLDLPCSLTSLNVCCIARSVGCQPLCPKCYSPHISIACAQVLLTGALR